MDPISIITLTASTIEGIYKVSVGLYTFVESARTVDARIESLVQEVTGVRRVLDAIAVVFANPLIRSSAATARENAQIWAAVAGSINDCRVTVERLDRKLDGSQGRTPARNLFAQGVKWAKLSVKVPDIDSTRAQMRLHAQNLGISLQLVTILAATLSSDKRSLDQVSDGFRDLEAELGKMEAGSTPGTGTTEQHPPPPRYEECVELSRHTQLVRETAQAVLSCSDGKIHLDADEREQQLYAQAYESAVASCRRGGGGGGEREARPPAAADSSSSSGGAAAVDSDEETETHIAVSILNKAHSLVRQRAWAAAEKLFRDGFHHLRNLSAYPAGVDMDGSHLLLTRCCMHQHKWPEAELLLSLFLRNADADADSEPVLRARHLLAAVCLALYDFEAALAHCRAALAGRRARFGAASPECHASRWLLALIHAMNGDVVSERVYAAKIPAALLGGVEDALLVDKFGSYSKASHLRTSLAEKAAAIEQLLRSSKLGASLTLPEDAPAVVVKAAVSAYNPNIDGSNLDHALLWAVHEGHELCTRWLLSRNADPETLQRNTPIIIQAAARGHDRIVALLVGSGVDVNSEDNSDQTALHWAALHGHQRAVRTLVESGADVDAADENGWTPMMNAAIKGHVASVEYLISQGANKEARNSKGNTALLLAARDGQTEVARLLTNASANVHVQNLEGTTPLIAAADARDYAVMKLLVARDPSVVRAQAHNGKTALGLITTSGKASTIRLLLANGADVDAAAPNDRTPLCSAADWGVVKAIRVLLEFGADTRVTYNDRTPLQIAKEGGYPECARLIEEYEASRLVSPPPSARVALANT